MIATDRLLEVLVEVADTLVDDYDLVDFLHSLAENVATISEAAAVGLLLSDQNEHLHFMAASSEGARHLELFQLQNAEGPCLDCFRTGVPVIVPDMTGAGGRWPQFAPKALQVGFRSVHAFPMRLRGRVIGAMNVFGDQPLPLQDNEVKAIQAMADIATIAIVQERAISAAETLTEQLQGALNSRIVIEQAKGVLARSRGLHVDAAFTVLRDHARRNGLRLTEVAHALVAGELDPATLDARR